MLVAASAGVDVAEAVGVWLGSVVDDAVPAGIAVLVGDGVLLGIGVREGARVCVGLAVLVGTGVFVGLVVLVATGVLVGLAIAGQEEGIAVEVLMEMAVLIQAAVSLGGVAVGDWGGIAVLTGIGVRVFETPPSCFWDCDCESALTNCSGESAAPCTSRLGGGSVVTMSSGGYWSSRS